MLEALKTDFLDRFDSMPRTNLIQGFYWYESARKQAIAARKELLDRGIMIPLFKVIGVIAALSPNNKWENNVRDAIKLIEVPLLETKVSTFKANRIKALAILGLSDYAKMHEVTDILGGMKTKSFFLNILNPKGSEVTIDLWMYRIAGLKPSLKNYQLISQAIIEVADKHNVAPNQLQAALWVNARSKV